MRIKLSTDIKPSVERDPTARSVVLALKEKHLDQGRKRMTRYSQFYWPLGRETMQDRTNERARWRQHKTCYEIVMRIYVYIVGLKIASSSMHTSQTRQQDRDQAHTREQPKCTVCCSPAIRPTDGGRSNCWSVGLRAKRGKAEDAGWQLVECTTKPKKHIVRSGRTRKI